jgi:hypothetical protein
MMLVQLAARYGSQVEHGWETAEARADELGPGWTICRCGSGSRQKVLDAAGAVRQDDRLPAALNRWARLRRARRGAANERGRLGRVAIGVLAPHEV